MNDFYHALYLLALAAILLGINLYTYQSDIAKKISYYGMWSAIAGSIFLVIRSQF